MHTPTRRHAWIAALALALIGAMTAIAQFAGDRRFETLASSAAGGWTAPSVRAQPAPPARAPSAFQRVRVPLMEPVADLAGAGLGAALALAEADGSRARVVRLTPAGPAREESLPRALDISVARARPLFELAYRLESGADAAEPTPIEAASWRALWAERANRVPGWLMSMPGLAPTTRVPVGEVLSSLAEIRARFRSWPQLRARLRASAGSAGLVRHFGSSLAAISGDGRGADFSASAERERLGAFIGWIGADRPAVFSGAIGDRDVVRRWARNIEDSASAGGGAPNRAPTRVCVEARFQPVGGVDGVRNVKSGQLAEEGPLRGYYQARLEGGRAREFLSNGEIELRSFGNGGGPGLLRATLALEEYIARVIDRAGVADNPEAAKAVAIVARAEATSWPIDRRGCRIAASSSVTGGDALPFSLSPASQSARRIVAWTADLGLAAPVASAALAFARKPASIAGHISGSAIMKLAEKGLFFDEILRALGLGSQVTVGRPAAAPELAASASQN